MITFVLMCGICGVISMTSTGAPYLERVSEALSRIAHRGPDNRKVYQSGNFAFGHARLSIIDPSEDSNQPFIDKSSGLVCVFNGEIFNYKTLRSELEKNGEEFVTEGDVEVLCRLIHNYGLDGLNRIHGFFAFCIYDESSGEFILARDRFGVKPLYLFRDENHFCFASELKGVLPFIPKPEIDISSLWYYLSLNFLPGNMSMLRGVSRMNAGEAMILKGKGMQIKKWYQPDVELREGSKTNLKDTIEVAVQSRLVADVPVGTFLSGGIDSTIVTGLASQLQPGIESFSLGFTDHPFFDESTWAELAARKFGTRHHRIQVTDKDLLEDFFPFLDSIDEPFADSSAFNVYILSKYTRKHVKVALSGDGADELFAGYNRHRAYMLASQNHGLLNFSGLIAPVLNIFPQSRKGFFSNKLRQLQRFAKLKNLSDSEKYWYLSAISQPGEVASILKSGEQEVDFSYRNFISAQVNKHDFNTYLRADVSMVLEGDMLVKADRMSMRHGLEIRNPFLDHRVIEQAFLIPSHQKINSSGQKIILKQLFSDLIPPEILQRKKKGFELPLEKWLKRELRPYIEKELLSDDLLAQQGIFNLQNVHLLYREFLSSRPGDSTARLWAILVFNHWWKSVFL